MRKENDLFKMNLQFFAEGEGGGEGENGSETAEQISADEGTADAGGEESSEGENEEVAAPQPQSAETNAAFANMRRQMQAAQKQAADIDAMYARQFGQYSNPETGKPIRSARDYAEAMAAQQRMQARQQLQENNIDPSLIDNMIANSPVVRQAEAATAELNTYRAQQMMEADFTEVMKFDPSKGSADDIINDPSYMDVVNYVANHSGIRFSDAYKIVNFDRLSSSKTAAARQAVVNQVKGESHLANGNSINTGDSLDDIPASMVDLYKEAFPDKSTKELKALYNKAIKNRNGG